MKKSLALLLPLIMVFILIGCGAPQEEQPEEQIDYEIAMVTDAGMIMDGGYSQVAWTAISRFGAEKGVSHKYYKAAEASETAYKEAIDNAVGKGAKIIIADGYSFEDVVYNAQNEYKDVKFILIDAEPVDQESGKTKIGKNTTVMIFASEQAGYLAGYSAVKDGNTKLGFIGDAKKPTIMDYGYGFLQGADIAAQEDNVSVDVKYHYSVSGDSRESVLATASKWYQTGTEVIFACGDQTEQPVIEAAEFADKKVIAAETDKSQMSDTVMTSAVKDITGALQKALKQYKNGEFAGGCIEEYNAENGGILLEIDNGRFKRFSEGLYENKLNELKSGNVTVKRYTNGDIPSLQLSNVDVSEQ